MGAHIAAIGGIWDRAYDPVALSREDLLAPGRTRFSVLAPEAGARMQAAIAAAKADRDSLGGIIAVSYTHLDVYKRQLYNIAMLQ